VSQVTDVRGPGVERLSEKVAGAQEWDRYVRNHPRGSHWHLAGWRGVFERAYGHRSHYLLGRGQDGKVTGVLPLVHTRSSLFGSSLVSLPFVDGGGVCVEQPQVAARLADEALALARNLGVGALELRHREPSGLDLPRVGAKVTCVLHLAANADETWRRLDAKVRNQVRKALSSGLTVAWGGLETLDEFYRVFAVNMRDLGSPVHGREWFQALLEEFEKSARLVLVRQRDRAVAGGVCLTFGDTLLVPWASALRESRSLCPNNLLYWEVMRWGNEKGFRTLDFGRSSPGSGTHRFKRQWGARDEPLAWERMQLRGSRGGAVDADDGSYGLAVRIWRRLPVRVATGIGPWLRGQLVN
jgi:FemAB-related protein (PEP-CTERM system-associated)